MGDNLDDDGAKANPPIEELSLLPPQPSDQSFSELVASATDRTLEFLSTASNETLGACLVGLGAATYIVLGRVGLVFMGVVGGVALHASWESKSSEGHEHTAASVAGTRKKESGIDVVRRVLDWKDKRSLADSATTGDIADSNGSIRTTDFSDFRPETAAALNALTDAIVKDYVK